MLKLRFLQISFATLAVIPVILLMLPVDFFDHGQSMCISKLLFNQECYGCGMTKGVHHLMHFDFDAAMGFNKLSLIVLPLLIFLWVSKLKHLTREIKILKS